MARYNPYQMALGRQDEVIDTLSRIGKAGETSAARVGTIGDLRSELFNLQKEKYKKIDEEVKKSQKKAKRGGLFRKLLKVAGLFMGPIGAGLTSGIAGMDAAKKQKGALKYLAKALEKHGEFSGKWRGKTAGLNWLSQPTAQFTENVMSGKRDVEKSASKINPLKAGLTAGLTSALSAKASGKEGIFGGGKLKDAFANIGQGGVKDLLSQQFLPGFKPETATDAMGYSIDPTYGVKGQAIKDYLKTKEGAKAALGILPSFTGALEEDVFELPDYGRTFYR